MTINILNETDKAFDFDHEKLITDCVAASCDHVHFPYEPTVDILITDLSGIHEINREQRGLDRPTDVLSFPTAEYEEEGNFEVFEEDPSLFDPDTGEAMLGDIVICYDKVISQAADYGHSVKRELAFLTVHSMLHLFGYDHEHEIINEDNEISGTDLSDRGENGEEAADLKIMGEKMEKAQDEILNILHISRD